MRTSIREPNERKCWNGWLYLFLVPLMMLSFSSAFAGDISVKARWASNAPVIDGTASAGEWNSGTVTKLKRGKMVTMNDGQFLYVLLDLIEDTGNDSTTADYYVLTFDADLNHSVSPNVDFFYDVCGDGRPFTKAYYLTGTSFTGCQDVAPESQHGRGFGATFNARIAHRFYEFRLSLAEIGVDTTEWTTSAGNVPKVRLNVAGISSSPSFSFAQPDPNIFPSLANDMFVINLAALPSYPVGSAGPTFAGVGLVPASYIDSAGYANLDVPGYAYTAFQAPFGGNLNVFGNWANLRSTYGARSYRIKYSRDGGPANTLIQTWTNFRFNPVSGNWDPVAFAPDASGKYSIPTTSILAPWYLPNLLTSWQTGQFGDGTYALSLELFDASGNPLSPPIENSLTLYLVNTPPLVKINQVSYNGAPVSACAIVTQGPAPVGFTYDISVTDAHGALNDYSLYGYYGDNLSSYVYSDAYNPGHLNEDGPEKWNGESHLTVPTGAPWRAPAQCAYTFNLTASSRSQNGYGPIFPSLTYHISMTVLNGVPAITGPVTETCCNGLKMPAGDSAYQAKPVGIPE